MKEMKGQLIDIADYCKASIKFFHQTWRFRDIEGSIKSVLAKSLSLKLVLTIMLNWLI